MLVLTRRQGQFIRVKLPDGQQIKIYVKAIQKGTSNGQVRVGIEAPATVQVDRGELALDDALKVLKQEVGATCSDETFIEVWANMRIPSMGRRSARELITQDESLMDEVIHEIKRNFTNVASEFHGRSEPEPMQVERTQ